MQGLVDLSQQQVILLSVQVTALKLAFYSFNAFVCESNIAIVLVAGLWLPEPVVRWFRIVAAQLG